MKTLGVICLLLISNLGMAGTPVKTLVPVDEVFVPNGFDVNDNSEIIVSGYLPNLCHKSPQTEIKINGNKIHVKVSALKYGDSNPFCPEMIVPFLETIKVGVLDKGNYEILINEATRYEQKSSMYINESVSNALDDHIYANVFYVDSEEGDEYVNLKGYNPSDCLEYDHVEIISNKSNTYSVLPIMKKVRDFCPMKMTPFSYQVKVPKLIQKSRVLLHVRGMDGNSVNSLYNFQ